MPHPRRAGRIVRSCAACLLVPAVMAIAAGAQQRFLSYADAQPIIAALGAGVPAPVNRFDASSAADWSTWIADRDREIRQRLLDGDDDTILNWLLLGTSFTTEPPVVLDARAASDAAGMRALATRLAARLEALLNALKTPGADERRLFARDVLRHQGIDVATAAGSDRAREYLLERLEPFLLQWTTLRQQTSDVRFDTRGLSLDTSLQPNFAVDTALAELKARGLVGASTIGRVAIVGAGLDFADKNSGFDFYAPQTVQPFAVLDSLRRLGLAATQPVEIVAFDISPRVLDHVAAIGKRAAAGQGYLLNLPLDASRPWLPPFRSYWQTFGLRVGTSVAPARPPAGRSGVEVRAVRLSPTTLRRLSSAGVNIVTERYGGRPFDLVVATNVLIYYNEFEQALALSNVAQLLSDRGLFLTNTRLPDVAGLPIRRLGGVSVAYTADGAGDDVSWYGRAKIAEISRFQPTIRGSSPGIQDFLPALR